MERDVLTTSTHYQVSPLILQTVLWTFIVECVCKSYQAKFMDAEKSDQKNKNKKYCQ